MKFLKNFWPFQTADDPNPEYSRLDRMDGLGGPIINQEAFTEWAQEHYGDKKEQES